MAANDYGFKSENNKIYLTKKLQNDKISKDKREITKNEIFGVFAYYLSELCRNNKTDTFTLSIGHNMAFEVKLIDLPVIDKNE